MEIFQFRRLYCSSSLPGSDVRCKATPLCKPLTCFLPPPPPNTIWNTIWKINILLKICNCIWRLLRDSLPTFLTLEHRGIANIGQCPLCDSDEESYTHLFLKCPFSRACWYGSQLAIQSSKICSISVQQWVSRTILDHN